MTFEKLHSDTSCDCVEDLNEDTEAIFSRRISGKQLKEKDFRSYWERGKRPESEKCSGICDFKGVSINILSSFNENEVFEIYKESRKINPNISKYITKFKLKSNAGIPKPDPIENNPFHYNFFKCDEFSIEKIDNLNILEIDV